VSLWQDIRKLSLRCIYSEVEDKIHEYFAAGVRQVWIIYSKYKTVTIYRSPTQATILTENDILTCEELLPNFSLSLKDIFKMPRQSEKK
jgi:Uma2 family endonuclease